MSTTVRKVESRAAEKPHDSRVLYRGSTVPRCGILHGTMQFNPISVKELCCLAPAEDRAIQTAQQLPEAKRELATFPEADMKNLLLKTQRPIWPNSGKNRFIFWERIANNDDFWVGGIARETASQTLTGLETSSGNGSGSMSSRALVFGVCKHQGHILLFAGSLHPTQR